MKDAFSKHLRQRKSWVLISFSYVDFVKDTRQHEELMKAMTRVWLIN